MLHLFDVLWYWNYLYFYGSIYAVDLL